MKLLNFENWSNWDLSDFFSLKNMNLQAHFLLLIFFHNINFYITYFQKWCPIFDSYSNFQSSIISLHYSWFLPQNLSNFVSLPWKLHNRYCRNSKFLAPVIYFADPIWTSLWAVWVEQHAQYIWFLLQTSQEGLKCIIT